MFLPRDATRMRGTCYGRVAGCHTPVYCINTAKPILKLFQPSASPIILVSSDPIPREPLQRGR